MRLTIFLLMLRCLLADVSLANGIENYTNPTHPQENSKCDIPAPTNFQVIDVGPTWAQFTWISSDPMASHRLRVFETNGTLVSTSIVSPGALTYTVNGLAPDLEYYAIINAICPDGSNSTQEAPPAFFGTPILDLFTEGYTPSTQTSSCSITSAGQSCSFSINLNAKTTFEVAKGNLKRQFTVGKNPTTNHLWVAIEGGNPYGTPIWIKLDDIRDPVFEGGSLFYIKLNLNGTVTTIANFDMSAAMEFGVPVGRINVTTLVSGWTIQRLNAPYGFHSPNTSTERADPLSAIQGQYPIENIRVSPNPFSETLDLHFPAASNSNVQCQLFNLQGQAVLAKVLESPQAQVYSLNTAGLAPGFYLLRIETEGKTQTIKVVKTE